jgi:hypothetical protein
VSDVHSAGSDLPLVPARVSAGIGGEQSASYQAAQTA